MDISLPLNKMTNSDKIAIMEKLWDDLCKNPESIPSPEWHKEVLEAREKYVKEGKAEFSSLEKTKERIMDKIKDHFEQEAHEFDEIIIKLIPYYSQMLDALITSIPFEKNNRIKVIDLGCGTGTISKIVKEKYPSSVIHCVDIAKNMIKIARLKLSDYSDITYENADLSDYSFTDSNRKEIGTTITLSVNNESKKFLEGYEIRSILKNIVILCLSLFIY